MSEAERKAEDWVTDYKPFDTNLSYIEYARHGYEEGYKKLEREVEELKALVMKVGENHYYESEKYLDASHIACVRYYKKLVKEWVQEKLKEKEQG